MAHATDHAVRPLEEQTHLGTLAPTLIRVGLVMSVGGLGAGLALWATGTASTSAFLHAWLLAVTYFMAISIGALFFIQAQQLTRAGWSTSIRRLAEIIATALPWLGLLLLPAAINAAMHRGDLFSWADPAVMLAEPVLQKKAAYLNAPFLLVRTGLYIAVWAIFTRFFFRQSVMQDDSGDWKHTYRMQWVAAPATAFFALSVTFFAFDYLMGLEASFYSTVFGIYFFAGSAMSFFAFTALLVLFLQRRGILGASVHQEHFHDLGKLMFGFVFFWGYIAFSQYMLIWYGNMPEETQWIIRRQEGLWWPVSMLLLFGHLLLPFPGLLSRHVKRSRKGLAFWATWLLVMEFVDLYWLIMPSAAMSHAHGEEAAMLPPHLGLLEVSLWLGVAGLFVLHFALRARNVSLRPLKDPRLGEAFAFQNV